MVNAAVRPSVRRELYRANDTGALKSLTNVAPPCRLLMTTTQSIISDECGMSQSGPGRRLSHPIIAIGWRRQRPPGKHWYAAWRMGFERQSPTALCFSLCRLGRRRGCWTRRASSSSLAQRLIVHVEGGPSWDVRGLGRQVARYGDCIYVTACIFYVAVMFP